MTTVPDRSNDPRRKLVAKEHSKGIHVEDVNDRNDVGGAIYSGVDKNKALQLHAKNLEGRTMAPRNKHRKSKGRRYL